MNLRLLSALTTTTALALGSVTTALAQSTPELAYPDNPNPVLAQAADPQGYTLVHVNPVAGSDTSGDGTQLRPYQTIAHALQEAPPGSIVLLAAGEYSQATGERFPIQLRSGITVQGVPGMGGTPAVIRGSGIFSSATEGMIHTTVVGVDGAGLGNVTVTNTSTAGYGLVVEAGRPVIRQNRFTGSGYGGMYVAGNSAPVIEGNQFVNNGVVGLAIAGQATAEVRSNRFEQTGIGIRVAPGAQPHILNNTIVQNQEGILLDGSAQPRLENNVIAQNRRNGVVEFQTALKTEAVAGSSGSINPAAIATPAALPPTALINASVTTLATPSPLTPRESPVPSPPQPSAIGGMTGDVIPPPPTRSEPTANAAPREPVSPLVATAPPVELVPSPGPEPTPRVAAAPHPRADLATPITTAPPTPTNVRPAPSTPPPSGSAIPAPEAAAESNVSVSSDQLPTVESSPITTPLPTPVTPATTPIEPMATNEPTPSPPLLAVVPPRSTLPLLPTSEPVAADATPNLEPSASEPSAAVAPTPPASSNPEATSIHERLRRIRQSAAERTVPVASSTAASSPEGRSNGETDSGAVAIPIQVIPPPTQSLARASSPREITVAAPATPRSTTTPTAATATELSLLRVPGGNIPLGSGGSNIPNLSPPSVSSEVYGAAPPPPPPSHAAMLGLVYKVFVPAADAATQAQVRAVVADAFRVTINGQTMMQAGAYADQATAAARATELLEQGLEARVEHIP